MPVVAQMIHSAVLSGLRTLHGVVGCGCHLTASRFCVLGLLYCNPYSDKMQVFFVEKPPRTLKRARRFVQCVSGNSFKCPAAHRARR